MIRPMIFDLDGTLVQTEKLKARSYAKAAVELCPHEFEEQEVIEDSPSGVEAALAAGMWCIDVTTPFTRQGVHDLGMLEERWIVEDTEQVADVVRGMVGAREVGDA